MELEKLCGHCKVSYVKRYLQHCQTFAEVCTDKGNEYLLIYDADNGHWLWPTNRKEVGYLFDLRISESVGHERIKFINEFPRK